MNQAFFFINKLSREAKFACLLACLLLLLLS